MKSLLTTFLVAFLALSAFAQPPEEPLDSATAEAMLKKQMAILETYNNYNNEVNYAMQTNQFLEHRLNLNAKTQPVPGVGAYNQNVSIYYEQQGNVSILKKIVVLTIKGRQQEYTEFLFDENKSLYIVNYNPDMGRADAPGRVAYYYEQDQMVLYTKNNEVFSAAKYDPDAFEESVEWLNKSSEYIFIFEGLSRVQPSK